MVVLHISSDRFEWLHFNSICYMDEILFTLNDRRLSSDCCYCFLFSICIQGKTSNNVSFSCFSKNHVSSLKTLNCKCVVITCVQVVAHANNQLEKKKWLFQWNSLSTYPNKNIHSFCINSFIYFIDFMHTHTQKSTAPATANVDESKMSVTSMINSIK